MTRIMKLYNFSYAVGDGSSDTVAGQLNVFSSYPGRRVLELWEGVPHLFVNVWAHLTSPATCPSRTLASLAATTFTSSARASP